MTNEWTTSRIPLAVPADLIDAARTMTAIFAPGDPIAELRMWSDEPNAYIEGEDEAVATHYRTHTPLVEAYLPLLNGRSPEAWQAALTQMATDRGREEYITETFDAEIASLCTGMLIGPDECVVLDPIE